MALWLASGSVAASQCCNQQKSARQSPHGQPPSSRGHSSNFPRQKEVGKAAKWARTRETLRENNGDPGGIRTRDLDLERVASWARLDDGVSDRQYTRPTAER